MPTLVAAAVVLGGILNCIFLFSCLTAGRLQITPNRNWQCIDCGPNSHGEHAVIFGLVRRAMHSESREVFLNFDHRWIDDVLYKGDRAVVVRHVHREKLHEYVAEPPRDASASSSSASAGRELNMGSATE